MAFNGTILANIYDINTYTAVKNECFFVDTNVWFWLTYSKGIPVGRGYLQQYNTFINDSLGNSSILYHSGLSLAELAHIIEKSEREIYGQVIGRNIATKEFRSTYSSQRSIAIREIETSWQQVESLATQVNLDVCKDLTTNCMSSMKNNTLDGYDLMIYQSMKASDINNIITDDSDYASVNNINVFTSNRGVLAAARAQGKLKS